MLFKFREPSKILSPELLFLHENINDFIARASMAP